MARDTLADKMEYAIGGTEDSMKLMKLTDTTRQTRDGLGGRRRATGAIDEVAPVCGVFQFFMLAPELRDKIYENALQYKRKFKSQHSARLRGRRVAELSLLLVSRQFRQEYLERAEQKTCLVIVDRDHYHGGMLQLPTPIKCARKLELHLALACDEPDHTVGRCRILPELRMHRKWIVDLCEQMKHLDSVTINVLIDPHALVADCEQGLLNEQYRFSNLETVASVEVYHCDYFVGANTNAISGSGGGKTPSSNWNFTKPRKLIMTLSPESGYLQRVCEEATAVEEGAT
ncbi:hypothetical protein LTR65_007394 [Meristemomyces frigidus]